MARDAQGPSTAAQAEAFLADFPVGLTAFHTVDAWLADRGECELRVARTQVSWARRRGFAFLWLPGAWLAHPGADVVLTIGLLRRDRSPRWKEVTESRPGLFVHHLELHDASDLDSEVEHWLEEAFESAG
jgi:hypothetical protein